MASTITGHDHVPKGAGSYRTALINTSLDNANPGNKVRHGAGTVTAKGPDNAA